MYFKTVFCHLVGAEMYREDLKTIGMCFLPFGWSRDVKRCVSVGGSWLLVGAFYAGDSDRTNSNGYCFLIHSEPPKMTVSAQMDIGFPLILKTPK